MLLDIHIDSPFDIFLAKVGGAISTALPYVVIGALLCSVALAITALLTHWWRIRGFVYAGQSPAVRRCALRLTSLRRKERLRAAELLGEMNDRTAVPALVRAIRRNRRDGGFLEAAVRSLAHLGDDRALPVLRELTSGHHYGLMKAAREAVAAIEPASVLLRATPESEGLLRPAGRGGNSESQHLLRAPRS